MKHALITFCVEIEGNPSDENVIRMVVPRHTKISGCSVNIGSYDIAFSDFVKPSIEYVEVANETR